MIQELLCDKPTIFQNIPRVVALKIFLLMYSLK